MDLNEPPAVPNAPVYMQIEEQILSQYDRYAEEAPARIDAIVDGCLVVPSTVNLRFSTWLANSMFVDRHDRDTWSFTVRAYLWFVHTAISERLCSE